MLSLNCRMALLEARRDASAKRGRTDGASDASDVSSNYPPSDISGGSANSFDRHLSASKVQELFSMMERQGMEISLLKQQLAEVQPTMVLWHVKPSEAQRRPKRNGSVLKHSENNFGA